jgi:hypothetical protein
VNDLEVIKGLAGMGTLGVAIGVGYFLYIAAVKFLDKQQVASDRKDDLFAATLKESAADLKSALAEVKVGLESVGRSVVEVDRGHAAQARETFEAMLAVNDKQSASVHALVAEIAALKAEVAALSRSVPEADGHPSPEDPPGEAAAPARGLGRGPGRGDRRERGRSRPLAALLLGRSTGPQGRAPPSLLLPWVAWVARGGPGLPDREGSRPGLHRSSIIGVGGSLRVGE